MRNNRLSACLPGLVDVLRNTVPVIEVLEEIRISAETATSLDTKPGSSSDRWSWVDVDTYPKAAAWWRVTFGPGSRHALDFRLMRGARIAIIDAWHIMRPLPSADDTPLLRSGADDALLLRPIPHLREILVAAMKDLRSQRRGRVAMVDVGVVCDVVDAAAMGRRIWAGVLREFGVAASESLVS